MRNNFYKLAFTVKVNLFSARYKNKQRCFPTYYFKLLNNATSSHVSTRTSINGGRMLTPILRFTVTPLSHSSKENKHPHYLLTAVTAASAQRIFPHSTLALSRNSCHFGKLLQEERCPRQHHKLTHPILPIAVTFEQMVLVSKALDDAL